MTHFHKDAAPIPTDPLEIRRQIRAIQDHRIFSRKSTLQRADLCATIRDMVFDDGDSSQEKIVFINSFDECVITEFAYVNPANDIVDDDDFLNTKFAIWIEAGGISDVSAYDIEPDAGWNQWNSQRPCFDHRLYCGGDTMPDALLALAQRVSFYYNDDGSENKVPAECKESCENEGSGYCRHCGYECHERKHVEED